jgi:hypothetical protein
VGDVTALRKIFEQFFTGAGAGRSKVEVFPQAVGPARRRWAWRNRLHDPDRAGGARGDI